MYPRKMHLPENNKKMIFFLNYNFPGIVSVALTEFLLDSLVDCEFATYNIQWCSVLYKLLLNYKLLIVV